MMENEIWNLFKGIAVIIDDGIREKEKSTGKGESVDDQIVNIVHQLRSNNIVCVTYDDIPSEDVIKSMTTISFLIVDWKFGNSPEGTSMGEAFQKDNEQKVISFLEKFLENSFAPIFLFTNEETESIKRKLKENGIYSDNGRNRVFVCQKSDVSTIDDIKRKLFDWIKQMPAVYAFKEWDKVIIETKNKLFIEMSRHHSNWVKVIYDRLEEDGNDVCQDFGDFLTKQLLYKASDYNFDSSQFGEEIKDKEELKDVLEGERYIRYNENNLPKQFYLGDLFYCEQKKEYYLNIRAQCDLSRHAESELYFITGTEYDIVNIRNPNIKIQHNDKRTIEFNIGGKIVNCDREITEINLNELSEELKKFNQFPKYHFGSILSKKFDYFLICVDGGKCIQFDFRDFHVKKLKIEEDNVYETFGKRVGRVLPPYIYDIQQKCMAYITRMGMIPLPNEIFN
ncbi:MAG: hypothetical protein Q4E42_00735 [Phascolarctobacterium sp.]|nr:hypothetical protein [Phascolarctobacterium sp.]